MKLLEYEAKNILREFDIPIPVGHVITKRFTPEISLPAVIKSQVPVGGRGKAGGVKIVSTDDELTTVTDELFKHNINGFTPHSLLAEEVIAIDREVYLSVLIDRDAARIDVMAHKNGGVEVEENDKDSFLILPLIATKAAIIGQQLADYYDLPSQTFLLQELVKKLAVCFTRSDATLLEINPLIITKQGKVVAGDCKMELDDAALFRHPEWSFEAKPSDTNFVILNPHGTVATIANGAGLAMATVDAVTETGLQPANFLDIGGGANTESVLLAFERIMEFSDVTAIVINIFAGITRCDEVARAIIAAKEQIASLPPLYIRLAGTNAELALSLLREAGITSLPTLTDCLDTLKKESYEA